MTSTEWQGPLSYLAILLLCSRIRSGRFPDNSRSRVRQVAGAPFSEPDPLKWRAGSALTQGCLEKRNSLASPSKSHRPGQNIVLLLSSIFSFFLTTPSSNFSSSRPSSTPPSHNCRSSTYQHRCLFSLATFKHNYSSTSAPYLETRIPMKLWLNTPKTGLRRRYPSPDWCNSIFSLVFSEREFLEFSRALLHSS